MPMEQTHLQALATKVLLVNKKAMISLVSPTAMQTGDDWWTTFVLWKDHNIFWTVMTKCDPEDKGRVFFEEQAKVHWDCQGRNQGNDWK